MMRLRQKQSKTMRLSDLEQTDVIKERRLRENCDSMEKPILKIQNLNLYFTQYARGLRRRELHPFQWGADGGGRGEWFGKKPAGARDSGNLAVQLPDGRKNFLSGRGSG